MSLNKDWHLKNRMPKNATEQQRIDWHIKHARQCGCREIPKSLAEKMKKSLDHI